MLFTAFGTIMLSAVLHNLPTECTEVQLTRPAHDVVVVLNLVTKRSIILIHLEN